MGEMEELLIVTYRGIFQEVEEALGIYSDSYREESALLFLDHGDALGRKIQADSPVLLETATGKVVVVAKVSEEPHPGIGFMPRSPWSAQLLPAEAGEGGLLQMKRFQARVGSAGEAVTTIEEIGERIRGP